MKQIDLEDGKYYWIKYIDDVFDEVEIGQYSAYWNGFRIMGIIEAIPVTKFALIGYVSTEVIK
jgi:hypothetical protein